MFGITALKEPHPLVREFRRMSERPGESGEIGESLMEHGYQVFWDWRRYQEGEIQRCTFKQRHSCRQPYSSGQGSRLIERLFSVVLSCRQQNRSVLAFLKQSIEAHLGVGTMPSLVSEGLR